MKTSPNGALILDGRGLQSVRERVRKAFETARGNSTEELVLRLEPPQSQVLAEPAPAPKPLRLLADVAVPVLNVAKRKFRDVVVGHARPVYHIAVPTETADELIRQAVSVVKNETPKENRHEVEDE